MATYLELHNNQQFVKELQDCAKQLSEKLSQEDIKGASELIGHLIEVRDKNIFNAVGKLTRTLHDAIVNFHADGEAYSVSGDSDKSDIKDASDRLKYVIETTRAAANKTMELVEASTPLAADLGERALQFQDDWGRLKSRQMNADEFRDVYDRMYLFLGDIRSDTSKLNQNLQGILMEQGFQDLTGQVLRRVIGLICEVEENLVNLVRIASQVEDVTGPLKNIEGENNARQGQRDLQAEGPQIHAETRRDVVSGQDEVDDLLSSLGF